MNQRLFVSVSLSVCVRFNSVYLCEIQMVGCFCVPGLCEIQNLLMTLCVCKRFSVCLYLRFGMFVSVCLAEIADLQNQF